jgi:hypothetical protein
MKTFLKLAFRPPPAPEQFDTSLRYTDILFGFVSRELFSRLQYWTQLDRNVQLHLLVGTTLVLGSWIGFRRSLYRSHYQVKFFNLPLFRFITDQLMLILYFRIAVLTDANAKQVPPALSLSNYTIKLVMYVFILYVIWDLFGIWMSLAETKDERDQKKPLYPMLSNPKDPKMTDQPQNVNWMGFGITFGSLGLVALIWMFRDCITPNRQLLAAFALLLLYRWAKEIRTSCNPA